MKYFILIMAIAFGISPVQAQSDIKKVEVGDVLSIQEPSQTNFHHLNLPRANFIIKKGGIADFKSLIGKKVVVSEIRSGASGEEKVILKSVDGRKFFRSFPTISANFNKAIESGELGR